MRFACFAAVALCCSFIALAGVTVVAAPPPAPLCGVCGSSVENASISGATGSGTLDIYVDETGDSLWRARVPVSEPATERYRTNATALEAAVDRAWPRYHVADGDIRTIETTLENGTVVVNYTVDDVARRGVGESWILDYFHAKGPTTNYDQQARRVTIHTPDGTVVTNRPSDATVDENAATWTTDGTDSTDPGFDEAVYVTYGEGGLLGTASGHATIGLEIGPGALEQGVRAGLVPGAFLALAGIAASRVDWGRDAFDRSALERLLVVVGTTGAIGLVVVSTVATGHPFSPALGALSALGIGYAGLGLAVRRGGGRRSIRGVIGLAALVTAGTGALLWLLGGAASLTTLPFGLAAACFLPLGYAAERRSSGVVSLALGAVAALSLIGGAVALSLFITPAGVGVFVFWLLLIGWAGTVVVFGYPLALVGRLLAADADPADGSVS